MAQICPRTFRGLCIYNKGDTGGRLAVGCWCSSGQHASLGAWWRVSCCCVLILQCWCLRFLQCYSTDEMDAPSYGSPVRIYVNNQYSMRGSLDVDRSEPKCLSSLGVVDLDLSITPDVFGLRAFDTNRLHL